MTRHIHAELMMQYAQDAMETDKPWERWECLSGGDKWVNLEDHPNWLFMNLYRRKPKPYTPTLLDQALELEIEAMYMRFGHWLFKKDSQAHEFYRVGYTRLLAQRSPEMIEHLKQQGKHHAHR